MEVAQARRAVTERGPHLILLQKPRARAGEGSQVQKHIRDKVRLNREGLSEDEAEVASSGSSG